MTVTLWEDDVAVRAYEDFAEGLKIDLPSYEVTKEQVIEFAAAFDPQPFHLDEEAAKETLLAGLAASGWHTCAMMMRMMADGFLLASTSQGSPGIEFVRWKRPVRPGDTLVGDVTVKAARLSASRPTLGIVRFVTDLRNTAGETVLESEFSAFMLTRAGAKDAGVAA